MFFSLHFMIRLCKQGPSKYVQGRPSLCSPSVLFVLHAFRLFVFKLRPSYIHYAFLYHCVSYTTDRLFKIFLVNRTHDTKPTVVSSVITKRVFSLATVRSGQVRSLVVPAIHHYYCYSITRISTIIRVHGSMSSRAARGQS